MCTSAFMYLYYQFFSRRISVLFSIYHSIRVTLKSPRVAPPCPHPKLTQFYWAKSTPSRMHEASVRPWGPGNKTSGGVTDDTCATIPSHTQLVPQIRSTYHIELRQRGYRWKLRGQGQGAKLPGTYVAREHRPCLRARASLRALLGNVTEIAPTTAYLPLFFFFEMQKIVHSE